MTRASAALIVCFYLIVFLIYKSNLDMIFFNSINTISMYNMHIPFERSTKYEVFLCVKSSGASRYVTNRARAQESPRAPVRCPAWRLDGWQSHTSRSRAASAPLIKPRCGWGAAALTEKESSRRLCLLSGGISPHRDPRWSGCASGQVSLCSGLISIQNDASRDFWKIISIRRGCHTGELWRVHAGQTSLSVRKQKGKMHNFLKKWI